MSKSKATELDHVMTKDGIPGKVDVSFRFNYTEENQCYVSFKLKRKGKKNNERQVKFVPPDVNVKEIDGKFVIPVSSMLYIKPVASSKDRFCITTKGQVYHYFNAGKKNICRRWCAVIDKYLTEFKVNFKSNRGSLNEGGVFSASSQFASNLSRNGNDKNRRINNSSRTLGSAKPELGVYKSDAFDMSIRKRQSNTTGRRGKTNQLQELAKTQKLPLPLANTHMVSHKPTDMSTVPPPAPMSIHNTTISLQDFYRPGPPEGQPPKTKIFTTVKNTKIILPPKSKDIETMNRKVFMPILTEEGNKVRDRVKSERDYKFLGKVINETGPLRLNIVQNFDDRAKFDLIERLFKLNTIMDQVLVEKNENLSQMYILQKGSFVQTIPGPNEVAILRVASGTTYGDVQIKYGTASKFKITCKKPCEFWVLDRKDYLEILADNGKRSMLLKISCLKAVASFSRVLSQQEYASLAQLLEMQKRKKGTVVVDIGNKIDKIVFVAKGEISLLKAGDTKPRLKLVNGDHFGLVALFKKDAVSSFRLVVATDNTIYFTMSVRDFEEALGDYKAIIENAIMKQTALKQQVTKVKQPELSFQVEMAAVRNTLAKLEQVQLSVHPPPSLKTISEHVFNDTGSISDTMSNGDEDFIESPPMLPDIRYEDIEVLNLINYGNFGHVYTARFKHFQVLEERYKLKFQKPVGNSHFAFPDFAPNGFALKVMPRHKITKNGWQDKVDNEILAMAEVSHFCRTPFILQLYHSFSCPKFIHLLVELGEGGDLYGLLKGLDNDRLDERSARYYIASVVNGLDVLHQRKILYRDLKPENLILNNKGHLKVADLGLAKKTSRTFTQCGTPEYTCKIRFSLIFSA